MDDISKIMEQAREISKLMGTTNEPEPYSDFSHVMNVGTEQANTNNHNSTSTKDMSQMMNMMEMMKTMQGQNNNSAGTMDITQMMSMMEMMRGQNNKKSEAPEQHKNEGPQEPTEESAGKEVKIYDDAPQIAKMLKSAVPYMDQAQGKSVAVAAKLMELFHIMNSFEITAMSTAPKEKSQKTMLMAMKEHMSPDKAHMIEQMVNFMEMSEIMKNIERVNKAYAK